MALLQVRRCDSTQSPGDHGAKVVLFFLCKSRCHHRAVAEDHAVQWGGTAHQHRQSSRQRPLHQLAVVTPPDECWHPPDG
jgi:hypothetical protein